MKRTILTLLCLLMIGNWLIAADRFYPDDPLRKEPAPRDAALQNRKLYDYYDLLENSFGEKGDRNDRGHITPAKGVNTLGEPMDGAWYTHRHYFKPMSSEELMDGVGGKNPPSPEGPWTVVSAKSEGISPGFVMTDSKHDRYYVKFDPISNPELATGAEMISVRFFHALGYHVPDDYLIFFNREKLVLDPNVEIRLEGRKRKMKPKDLNKLLAKVPKTRDGKYRAIASLQVEGKPVGPFKYFGTRIDDPNDVVAHEHLRVLRGLFVFCAWLAHNDSRSINSLDTLVDEDGSHHLRHYLMDFGATLGSSSTSAKLARAGNEYYLDFKPAPKQMATLGLAVPEWAHAKFPGYHSVGGFDSAVFQPDKWIPDYPNVAFLNRLPDDEFWAAKQVMAFTDDEIRTIVKVAQYSDPRAERYVADTIIARRNKIGREYFPKVLALDQFTVENGSLAFRDLAEEHRLEPKGALHVSWSSFDNPSNTKSPIPAAQDFHVPSDSSSGYLAADIWRGDDKAKGITVYLRTSGTTPEVVGIDRTW